MKIKSVRLINGRDFDFRQMRDGPGRWYDEKTARLMERAVRLLVGESCDCKYCQPGWHKAWAKLTEKKTAN